MRHRISNAFKRTLARIPGRTLPATGGRHRATGAEARPATPRTTTGRRLLVRAAAPPRLAVCWVAVGMRAGHGHPAGIPTLGVAA